MTRKAKLLVKNPEPTFFFDEERAASYDDRWAKLAPMRDALHLLMRLVLSDLPDDARILCVGVGTGSELIALAQAFPMWQFAAVEPAAPMLNICRQRTEEQGIASRCTFHEGYLDSLPATEPFQAATCLLVSQFLMQKEARRELFWEISQRLRPQGVLISADISAAMSTPAFERLSAVWLQMHRFTGASEDNVENIVSAFGRDVAVLPPQEVESIIASSGFDSPVLFFQSLLIRAWFSKRIAQ